MQNDTEIYVDPEEDEVFFGCMSEREKNVCAKLAKCAETSSQDSRIRNVSNYIHLEEENIESEMKDEQSSKASKEVMDATEPGSPEDPEDPEKSNCSVMILPSNTSVELDHNYSTLMKHKIDKRILTAPESIVKADRDGGFLKVLSEIALAKAEAEGDKESGGKKEDEDKENKVVEPVPEIKITEATPEKGSVLSPPKSISTEMQRFRIVYTSAQSEDSIDNKSKLHSDNFESERNLRNECLDQENEKILSSESGKSVDLIDLNESALNEGGVLGGEEGEKPEEKTNGMENSEEVRVLKNEKPEPSESEKHGDVLKAKPTGSIPKGSRFSKEARKIVEVLKKSAVDDTLNFTVPEIDLENEEYTIPSPEPALAFDDTIAPTRSSPAPKIGRMLERKLEAKSETVEKERHKLTPVVSLSRLQPMKYFSERRFNKQTTGDVVRCAKKLPTEEEKAVEKNGGGAGDCNSVPTSRIPVVGAKNSKIPVNVRAARPAATKPTPSKTLLPGGKTYKNPKFDHIESPINAYIHSKPTSLVQNVKPEPKKDSLTKVWRSQTTASAAKLQKPSASAVRLPFVEYKSATPYKIEKRPESRLPRLAPTVMKLIGSNSPKVLKHEGRFYMKTPRKRSSTENSTIVAEANEVSVVVSHPAQKSHTFK